MPSLPIRAELSVIAQDGRNIFTALGSAVRTVTVAELEKRKKFRRRAILARALKAGHLLEAGDLKFQRPGTGIAPDQAPAYPAWQED